MLCLQERPDLCPLALAQVSGLCPGHLGSGASVGWQVTPPAPLCSWGFTVVHETEKHEKQQW